MSANTYSGVTTVTGAGSVLNIQNGSALGATTGGTVVQSGAALQLEGDITVGVETLNLSGSGVANDGVLRNISGDNAWGGLVTLAGNSRINSDSGTLTLSNVGTITGAFTLTVGGAGNTTINSNIGITTGTLAKDGAGILTLTGTNSYITATTIAAGGAINIQNGSALGTTAVGTTVSSGGALQIQGGIATLAEALTLAGTGVSNDGALRNISGDNTYTGVITIANGARINSDAGTLTLDAASGIAGTALSVIFGGEGNIMVADAIATTTGTLTKDGGGILTLSAANTYTGVTNINGGTLKVGIASALATTTSVNFGADAPVGTKLQINGFDITLKSLNSNATSPGSPVIENGTAGAVTLTVNNTVATPSLFAGVVQDGGAGALSLTKIGNGTLTLSGNNTYTGATTISTGVLNIQSGSALGDASTGTTVVTGAALQLQGGITVASETLTLNDGGVLVDGALRNMSEDNFYSGAIILGSDARIHSDAGMLTLNSISGATFGLTLGGAGNITVNGVIGITSGTLNKEGTGRAVLKGNNTYSGVTSVLVGNLQVGENGSGRTGTGPTTVAPLATLSGTGLINGTVNVTNHNVAGILSPGDNGGADNGVLTINGNLTATSATSVLAFDITNPTGTWADYVAAHPLLGLTGNANTELNTDDLTTDQGTYNTRMSDLAEFYKNTDPTAGAHDKLKVLGTLTINENTTITVNNTGLQTALVAGQVFNIIDATAFSNTGFDTGGDERLGGTVGASKLILPTLEAAYLWDTSKFLSHGVLVVVDPPAYWKGGAAESDPTSWEDVGNWVHSDGSAVSAIDGSMKLILSASGAQNQGQMALNHDMSIRELAIDDTADTTVSGAGTLKIAPVIDDGTVHNAITVSSRSGTATINTGVSFAKGARITVNNVASATTRGGLELNGRISAQTKLIKAGAGTLKFGQGSILTVGTLGAAAPETLEIAFDNSSMLSGALLMDGTRIEMDIFSGGQSDVLKFAGSLNTVEMKNITLAVSGPEDLTVKAGDRWTLFDWTELGALHMDFGTMSYDQFALNLPTLGMGLKWDIDRLLSTGQLFAGEAPEPGRAILLLFGLMVFLMRRRRSRSNG
jgi:autotransporter-associated beta strand protein